jgi:uncharacterized protein YyaL (SSP411 family)
MPQSKPNRLIEEKSPYLLQHAYNPVDWYPWGEEAFRKAEEEDKPVFMSIGYSTCHWCHVMETESFEDDEVASLLNQAFICVKVDREERPDIDGVYMKAGQMLTGGGGWPLTIIMTPDGKPFFSATYIPKRSGFNRVGIIDLIPQIMEYWKNQRERLTNIGTSVASDLNISKTVVGAELTYDTLDTGYRQLVTLHDKIHGGFNDPPKFPTPHIMLYLLWYWHRTGEKSALNMVERTLKKMRFGGIFDHLGYGFHRYSTDREWLVPHFEKMLYDQAMMILTYLETFHATKDNFYRTVAEEVITYVLRDLASPYGGFYSAEDADSEGEEGRFYTWSEIELTSTLSPEQYNVIKETYNIESEGNFRDEATSKYTGNNILHLKHLIKDSKIDLTESARDRLFEERETRVRPLLDDKILTDWNGLMIAALSRAAWIFDDQEYLSEATRAADFILSNMWNGERLLHMYRDGAQDIHGFLDDYAYLVWGLIELYQASQELRFLQTALDICKVKLDEFWDHESGGFYFSGKSSENLIAKRKEIYDGALPSGNSVSMYNLLRLSRITGDPQYENKANLMSTTFSESIAGNPVAYTFFLSALNYALGDSVEIVLVGEENSEKICRMLGSLRALYLPNKVIVLKKEGIGEIAPFTSHMTMLNGESTAYVCRNHSCDLPTTKVSEMLKLLSIQD